MDEILIEDKKYISSKQAAKVTGYAKDYIGQLCREGRVPARLVGRSWYVLESAIEDHRFGDHDNEIKTTKTTVNKPTFDSNPPRYASDEQEELPSLRRAQPSDNGAEDVDAKFQQSKQLQDAWGAWFDRISTSDVGSVEADSNIEEQIPAQQVIEETISDEQATVIPIHAVQEDLPPIESSSTNNTNESTDVDQNIKTVAVEEGIRASKSEIENKKTRVLSTTIIITSAVIALPIMLMAVISTGYFDNILSGYDELNFISGINVYNR